MARCQPTAAGDRHTLPIVGDSQTPLPVSFCVSRGLGSRSFDRRFWVTGESWWRTVVDGGTGDQDRYHPRDRCAREAHSLRSNQCPVIPRSVARPS